MTLTPKNWSEFQHYKDRCPPWVKLHRSLLDNIDFHMLSPLAGKLLPLIWIVASEKDGALPDYAEMAFRLRVDAKKMREVLNELISADFLVEVGPAEQFATTPQEKAEKHGFGSRHIPDEIKRQAWERDGGKCTQCGSDENIEYDHKVPVSRGGNSDLENIQLLCRPCNRSKRAKLATQPLSSRSPETEAQVKTEKNLVDLEFEKFRRGYPKRRGSQGWPTAKKYFYLAVKSGCSSADLVAAAQKFEASLPRDKIGTEFVPMAETWMRKSNWKEFIPTPEETARAEEVEKFLASKGYGRPAQQ